MLTDGVVLLRAHALADLAGIVAQCRDPEMLAFTTVPRPYDEAHARGFLTTIRTEWEGQAAEDRGWYWAIEDVAHPGVYRGGIHLRRDGLGAAEIGYGLAPQGRGRGLTARAVRLLLAYAAAHGLHTVRWRAVVGNWASRRVAWSCGFTHEGAHRALLPQPSEDGSRTLLRDGWIATWQAGEPMEPRQPWYVPAELAADGLLLRPWREEDGTAMPAELDEVAARFLPGMVPTRSTYGAWLLERREREASGTGVAWAIVAGHGGDGHGGDGDGHGGHVVGGIHLFDIQHARRAGNATLGVFVLPHARGRGVFPRALDAVLDHAFAPVAAGGLGLARVRSDADLANRPSVRAMLRGGMTYVGMTREERPDTRPGHEGERVDMCQFEVLASDDRAVVGEFNRRGWTPPATIHGEGVVLREFTESDVAAVARLMRDPEFGPEHRPHATEADARRWIIRGLAGNYRRFTLRWAICPADGSGVPGWAPDEPVGYIRAFALDGRLYAGDAEIGYTLHPDARRRGLASAAARALTDYLLTPAEDGGYGLRRVTAITAPENVASQKVLAAAGLTRWWVDRQVLALGEFGSTRSGFQGEEPSPNRWRYGRIRDDLPPTKSPAS